MEKSLVSFLETLSKQLGTTVEHLWNVLIIQAPLSAIKSLIWLAIILILDFIYYKLYKKLAVKNDIDDLDDANKVILIIVGILLSMVTIIFVPFCISNIIDGFFNPQFWALKYIIDQIQQN